MYKDRAVYNKRMAEYMRSYRKRNRHKCTMQRRARVNKRREFIGRLKDNPCTDCGIKYKPWQMDFDHIDPRQKVFNIGTNVLGSLLSIKNEIEKCELVCANCHRQRTHEREAHLTRP
jgi:hypothetical protein